MEGMVWLLLGGVILLGVWAIVRSRMKEMEADSAKAGLAINVHEATWLRTLSCRVPLGQGEIEARLTDGVPAGELICTWDADRAAYCFRSELPDGSAPIYFTVAYSSLPDGVRLMLTRQKTLLHGRRDGVMLLPGYLAAKLGATEFTWSKDEG